MAGSAFVNPKTDFLHWFNPLPSTNVSRGHQLISKPASHPQEFHFTREPTCCNSSTAINDLLSQLKQFSVIVADTGDFDSIRKYQPRDSTTNPSLLLKAAQMPEYAQLVEKTLADARKESPNASQTLGIALDKLAVAFGIEILNIVPGRVSTEVDARLSFDIEASTAKARSLISRYEQAGISRGRILIKVASTWEGICTARRL